MDQLSTIVLSFLLSGCAVSHAYRGPESGGQPTFYSVCWGDDGIGYTIDSCAEPREIIWDQLPVLVHADVVNEEIAKKAIIVWNRWLNFELFQLTINEEAANIYVKYGGLSFAWRGMSHPRRTKNGEMYFLLDIYDNALLDVGTMSHELGHAVGLDHDPQNPRSIMYPSDARWLPTLSPEDKLALRRRYL